MRSSGKSSGEYGLSLATGTLLAGSEGLGSTFNVLSGAAASWVLSIRVEGRVASLLGVI